MARDKVFIHTNDAQYVGAVVGRHALARNSAEPEAFDVELIRREDFGFFEDFEGRKFKRAGGWRVWRNADLQSFTPCRFAPPQRMGYEGRAVVTDPDVFAVGDVRELLGRDMQDRAVCARPRRGHNRREDYMASSVMLLDCSKLAHWNLEAQFESLFTGELDYEDWIVLAAEPPGSVGELEACWNDFDRLNAETRLLHTTKRRTQPWKTGLPIDYRNRVPLVDKVLPSASIRLPGRYKVHPDPRQEAYFFALLKECIDTGQISREQVERAMAADYVRHDALELVARAAGVDEILEGLPLAA